MGKIPDRANLIVDFLRERQHLAHQTADPLAQGVIQSLTMARLTAILADWPMALRRQHTGIGIPKIARTDGTLAIDRGQRIPQLTGRHFIACPDCHPDNFIEVAFYHRRKKSNRIVAKLNNRRRTMVFPWQSYMRT